MLFEGGGGRSRMKKYPERGQIKNQMMHAVPQFLMSPLVVENHFCHESSLIIFSMLKRFVGGKKRPLFRWYIHFMEGVGSGRYGDPIQYIPLTKHSQSAASIIWILREC